jgi:DNA-directed RNA polymerase specialized sigma24 family protein
MSQNQPHRAGSTPMALVSARRGAASFAGPRWPERLQVLCQLIQEDQDESSQKRIQGELWILLNACILRYSRYHATRYQGIAQEDLEDIAAEKSFDLLRRIGIGEWSLANHSPAEIAGCLSVIARRGLLDRVRQTIRRTRVELPAGGASELDAAHLGSAGTPEDRPDMVVERLEFATALRRCAEQLNPRLRLVWYLRGFCGLSARETAAHPDVRLKPTHVDVLLQRGRQAIRDCMQKRGLDPREIPPGTFVEIWKAFGQGSSHLE